MSMRKTTLAPGGNFCVLFTWTKVTSAGRVTRCWTTGNPPLEVAPGQRKTHVNSYRCQTVHRGKVDPGVSELSRDHVNRPLDWVIFVLLFLAKIALYLCTINKRLFVQGDFWSYSLLGKSNCTLCTFNANFDWVILLFLGKLSLYRRHLQRTYSARETGVMQGLEKHNLTRITNTPAAFLIQI